MTTAIIARQFRGQTLFLAALSLAAKDFTWSADRAKARKFTTPPSLKAALDGANEYRSEAYAIDTRGNVLVPAASAAVAKPLIDFRVENHGSLVGIRPLNDSCQSWLRLHVNDAQWFGGALMVEPRYVEALVTGMSAAGLIVEYPS